MKQAFFLAALLATIPAAACHRCDSGPGVTGGASTANNSGDGAGGTGTGTGAGGSCMGTTPPDVCSEMAPCPSGTMCVQQMDLTTCGVYGASCAAIPADCTATPTCDCFMNSSDGFVNSCSGDASTGFIVDYGYGDSECCP